MHGKAIRLYRGVVVILFVGFGMISVAEAVPLATLDARVISDSEESFDRRIYSYEMDVDSSGAVHIVYLKPTSGNAAEVRYVLRTAGGAWSEQTLSSAGLRGSLSIHLLVDDYNVVHICYVKSDQNLYYRTIAGSVIGSEKYVSPGGWHTRMQLDANNRATFVREGEDWHVTPSETKLVLVTTLNDETWSEDYMNLPAVNKFRIGAFVYKNGIYHVTYGDSFETRDVLTGQGSTTTKQGIFHNFYYASSSDGLNWSSSMVDNSLTLYEDEFWTSLVIDTDTPVVTLYKYAEYGGQYNTGTSALLSKWNGSSWQAKNVTPAGYPATREGMGVGLVCNGAGDYFGGWDFSPDNTYDDDFRGARGNIVLARSGSDGAWNNKWQVDEFSAEGEVKLRIKNNRLYYLALGDYIDTKLYFREYDMNVFSSPDVPGPSPSGKVIAPVQLLLKE